TVRRRSSRPRDRARHRRWCRGRRPPPPGTRRSVPRVAARSPAAPGPAGRARALQLLSPPRSRTLRGRHLEGNAHTGRRPTPTGMERRPADRPSASALRALLLAVLVTLLLVLALVLLVVLVLRGLDAVDGLGAVRQVRDDLTDRSAHDVERLLADV